MSLIKIRFNPELCRKLRLEDGEKFVKIYSLDIEEDEQGEQTMIIIPLKQIKTFVEWRSRYICLK